MTPDQRSIEHQLGGRGVVRLRRELLDIWDRYNIMVGVTPDHLVLLDEHFTDDQPGLQGHVWATMHQREGHYEEKRQVVH